MLKKKGKNNKTKILQQIRARVLAKLDELSEGLTLREMIEAHIEYYETCNTTEKQFLMEVFLAEENEITTQLALI